MATSDMPSTARENALDARIADATRSVRWRTGLIIGALVVTALYLVYAWAAFGVSEILARAQPERAAIFAKDAIAYKVHVTKYMRDNEIEINIESERTATYKAPPAWVDVNGVDARVDLGDDVAVEIEGPVATLFLPEFGIVRVTSDRREIGVELPDGAKKPDWMSIGRKRFDARIDWDKRLVVTASKIEIHRFFYGWENFWFDFESPLHPMSFGALWSAAWSAEPIADDQTIDDERVSNAYYIFHSFWNNREWRHGYVFTALFETILMAFLGTALAAIFALPLAFLAASNFTAPNIQLGFGRNYVVLRPVRFVLRRLFDFLRGIDMLIWSLIFIRAFGLGPLTGALAIAFTDTGSLGKLFSEALENVDKKQIEGVRATGASQLQRYKFGVIPQILPVLISQSLYFLESNTRSATVIGALGAGGIGLVLVETMNTQRDWENVLYLIIMTILVVILMDTVSGWLRRRLIEGRPDGR